jgi:hypothetical protein
MRGRARHAWPMSVANVRQTTPPAPHLRPGLVHLARRCWIDPEAAVALAPRCVAVLESSAADSVICGVTAAALHGLWLPPLPDTIHIATATPARLGRQMTRTRRPEFVAHRYQLRRDEVMLRDGVPVPNIAQTWRQLGAVLGLADLVAAGDSALRAGTSMAELAEVIRRARGARSVRRCRAAFALLDGRSRSRPESHLRVAVSAPDLPPFQVNEAVSRSDGGWLAEPDLSLVEAKLALEYQGEAHAQLRRMRKDMTRAADMRLDGWLVNFFGPAETFTRPWQIRAEVRAAIRQRAPHLLRRP